MHFTNPFTNPPRLPSPNKRRTTHNRSPSHSPARYRPRDHDPLLRDLSPSSTLRAFVSDPNEWTENTSNALARSILTSSHSERTLGAKAAQICLDVRSWTREMEHWPWPGTFEAPERAGRKARTSTLSFGTIASIIPDDDDEEFWGSLPAKAVRAYGKRADEIGQALDQIDVEELKEFVLSSHYRTGSRSVERGRKTSLKQLDDYTAVITATILQALPYLSRLNRLLDVWTIRLMILQSANAFVRDLQRARMDMDHGWAAIAVSTPSVAGPDRANFSRQTMLEMKRLIEHQVASLGRRLDRFLDDLEGREETVPDKWIEDFERLETAYSGWVVQAERKVLENEWRTVRGEGPAVKMALELDAVHGAQQGETDISHTEDPDSDGEAVIRPPINQNIDRRFEADLNVEDSIKPVRRSATDTYIHGTAGREWQTDTPFPRKSLSEERKSRNVSSIVTPDTANALPSTRRSISLGNGQLSDDTPGQNSPTPLPRSRTAFLNNIDQTNTLMKPSKSPVRPFEHASNAFTRLFKKSKGSGQGNQGGSPSENDQNSTDHLAGGHTSTRGREASLPGRSGNSQSTPPDAHGSRTRTRSRDLTTSITKQSIGDSISHDQDLDLAPILMPPNDISRRRVTPVETRGEAMNASIQPLLLTLEKSDPADNWPLPTPTDTSRKQRRTDPATRAMKAKSEIYSPHQALQSDAFDRMFVQNFPDPASARPRSAREARGPGQWTEGHKRARSMPRIKGKAPAVLSRSQDKEHDVASPYNALQSLSYVDIPGPSAAGSKLAKTPVAVASASSKISTPERSPNRDRQAISDTVSNMDSATRRAEAYISEITTGTSMSSSSHAPDQPVAKELKVDSDATADDPEIEKPVLLKRASITSVEAFKRADVKSVEVQGSSKQDEQSLTDSPPQTPRTSHIQAPIAPLNTAALAVESSVHKLMVPTPPRNSSLGKTSSPARAKTPTSRRHDDVPSSSPLSNPRESTPEGKLAPLNVAMTKRRGKASQRKENVVPRILTLSPSKKGAVFNPEGDTFDRHISEVLETLPSTIQFKTRPGAETPVSDIGEPRISGPSRAKNARLPPRPNVTIAPVESPPKRFGSTNDNEVKVYHLTQAGSDETIKLFVRLVGESERVMVRVGGGWADLADYLRQYADHHGSRTVSQGTLEFQPVNGTASRRVSGAAEQKGKQPVTPVSTFSKLSADDDQNWLSRPQPTFSMSDGTSSDEADTDTITQPVSFMNMTPRSSNAEGSRPSTANTERPSSRQSASDVKLSGSSSAKRAQLSEHKEKWVEGMIERAKQASAEKSKEDNQKYFAELGKAGATRRVIFRSSSAMSNRPNGNGGGDKPK